jgi:hypothetical protein
MEGIFTQLLFDHALRIRMIASTGTVTSKPATPAAVTPDTMTVDLVAESVTTIQGTETTVESTTPPAPSKIEQEPSEEKSKNLVGKLNNLVSLKALSFNTCANTLLLSR